MSLPLLQTKLYAPPLRLHLVPRNHLLDRLRNNAARPLTLVCAPAGFGKSTLVSAWIAQSDQPVAWLALDDDDNDPTRFLTYLIAALQTRQAQLGETALALLAAPQAPPAKTLLTLLLNDLGLLTAPLTLVLDDYHVITAQSIHEVLTFLIDHLPPPTRLILTSRIDPPLPLERWRVRNQLADVRAHELRFTPQETATFLNDVMGLTLSSAEITALETRTEGWIAGLQLAALSMQGRVDVTSFIQAFSGSNRHVLSYLVEEVLNRRPPDTLTFLLQSSILDRMCAPLCDAVTGETTGQANLAKLEQAHLFLIPLDDEGRWYR
jgi:LuxR family transcriptional regulator, maltose regulon positive regulatory protein